MKGGCTKSGIPAVEALTDMIQHDKTLSSTSQLLLSQYGSFRKLGVLYFGVLIIRILPRVMLL